MLLMLWMAACDGAWCQAAHGGCAHVLSLATDSGEDGIEHTGEEGPGSLGHAPRPGLLWNSSSLQSPPENDLLRIPVQPSILLIGCLWNSCGGGGGRLQVAESLSVHYPHQLPGPAW